MIRTAGEPTRREILALAVPALGSLTVEPLMGLVDTALLGRIGAVELAALGGANALLSLIAASLIFLEYGTTARLGRHFGAGALGQLSTDAVQMGWLASLLGLLLTGALFFFAGPLLSLLDLPEAVHSAAKTYLTIRALGAMAGLWVRVGNGIFRGLQDTRTPLWIMLGMNLFNAGVSILLVFGFEGLGIPRMGIVGAAWGTVAASWLGAATFVFLLRRRLGLGARDRERDLWIRWSSLREILSISRDLLLRTVGLNAALFAGTRLAARFGAIALAAHQVGWQLWIFLALLLDSLAIAAQALVARCLGAGEVESARRLGNRLMVWGAGLGVFCAVVFLLLRERLPLIFTDQAAILDAVGTIFLLLAWMQIPNAILFVLDGLLIGASDFRFLRNAMVSLGAFGVGATWVGARLGGSLRGVWWGLVVFMLARLVVMGARWRDGAWSGRPAKGESQ